MKSKSIIQFATLPSGLSLVRQSIGNQLDGTIAPKPTSRIPGTLNHIWIFDRSGSMWGVLSELVEDLCKKLDELVPGDTITIGWFSGERDFDFLFKGREITSSSREDLKKILRNAGTTRGTTCFSEILHATADRVITDLAPLNPEFALMFFTDGYPVVSNYATELSRIWTAIEKLQSTVSSSLVVGYGNYYNRELLGQMAERLGGSLIHSSLLDSQPLGMMSSELSQMITTSREVGKKQEIELEYIPEFGYALSVDGKQVNSYAVVGTGAEIRRIQYAPLKSSGDAAIYYLTTSRVSGEEVPLGSFDPTAKATPFLRGVYAAILTLSQRTKTDIAIDLAAGIGDVSVVDALSNAFTNEEYGRAEIFVKKAVNDPAKRFVRGQSFGYLPDYDAFCVLDLVELLMEDPQAKFYPYDPRFNYSRIGVKSVQDKTFPKFTPTPGEGAELASLTWNKEKLNLSLLSQISGTIPLSSGHKKLGLSSPYPTNIWRNYALVKDGFVNIPELPISMSEATFGELKSRGLVTGKWQDGKVYMVSLDETPLVNRNIATKSCCSAAIMAERCIRELKLTGRIKALKHYLAVESDTPTKSFQKAILSEEQTKFLTEHGITRNGFSPDVTKQDPTDSYFAKEFEIKIKGCSSLPKVEEVAVKMTTKKALTVSEALLEPAITQYRALKDRRYIPSVLITMLQAELQQASADLTQVRRQIQRTKFSILLGKKWFEEFSSRENCTIESDGYQVSFSVREVSVKI